MATEWGIYSLDGLWPGGLGKRLREELDDYQAEKKRARYAAHAPSSRSFKEISALDRYVDVREKKGILSVLKRAGSSQAKVAISRPKVISATGSLFVTAAKNQFFILTLALSTFADVL